MEHLQKALLVWLMLVGVWNFLSMLARIYCKEGPYYRHAVSMIVGVVAGLVFMTLP